MNEVIGLFTPQETERLTGVTPQRLRYWNKIGLLEAAYAEGTEARLVTRLYSFRNLVAARTLNKLLEKGVSPRELRKANAYLRQYFDDPWVSESFYVLGTSVVIEVPSRQSYIAAAAAGQTIADVPLVPIVNETRERVRALRERQPAQRGKITRRREIMSNAYCLDGTRIPTAAVWSFHAAGYSDEQIREEYPDLYPEDITEAINFERSQRVSKSQSA